MAFLYILLHFLSVNDICFLYQSLVDMIERNQSFMLDNNTALSYILDYFRNGTS